MEKPVESAAEPDGNQTTDGAPASEGNPGGGRGGQHVEQPLEHGSTQTAADSAEKVDAELIERLKGEAEQTYDKYLRAVAELENLKKRHIKERSDLIKYAGESLARDILEVLDNLQIALSRHANDEQGGEIVRGIALIAEQFAGILERHSIKGESSIGKKFDPQKEEAVASVPSTDHAPGTVLEEFKRAYFFKDKLLRPGQVVVATAPSANGSDEKKGD